MRTLSSILRNIAVLAAAIALVVAQPSRAEASECEWNNDGIRWCYICDEGFTYDCWDYDCTTYKCGNADTGQYWEGGWCNRDYYCPAAA